MLADDFIIGIVFNLKVVDVIDSIVYQIELCLKSIHEKALRECYSIYHIPKSFLCLLKRAPMMVFSNACEKPISDLL